MTARGAGGGLEPSSSGPGVEPGPALVHVVPSLSGGWVVRETADGPSRRRTNTRRGALTFATDLLFRGSGGEIHVHEADGTVVETYRVAGRGRRPWWYAPPRLLSMITGVFLMIEGVVMAWTGGHLRAWLGWLLVVTGAVQVASFVGSKLADRRLEDQQQPHGEPSHGAGERLDQG